MLGLILSMVIRFVRELLAAVELLEKQRDKARAEVIALRAGGAR